VNGRREPIAGSPRTPATVTTQAARGAGVTGRVIEWAPLALIGAVAIALAILRRPEALTNPAFLWEEPQVFYAWARSASGLDLLLRPWAGSLELIPRLAHAGLVWVPGVIEPAVMQLVFLAIVVVVGLFFASDRMADVVPSRAARAAFALVLVLLPAMYAPMSSILNVQWFVSLYLIGVTVAREPATALGRGADRVAVALGGLSGPASILLWPLYWIGPRTRHRVSLAVIVTATAVVQLVVLATSARRPSALDPGWLLSYLVASIGRQPLGAALGNWRPLGLLVLVGVAIIVSGWSLRDVLPRRAFLAFAYGGLALGASGLVVHGATVFVGAADAARYFIPLVGFLWVLALAGLAQRRPIALVLTALLAPGVVADFRMPPLPSDFWPAAVACMESTRPCEVIVPYDRSFEWPGAGQPYAPPLVSS
jgi:hypothetical protein